jgi:ketosteroid isomerase-like protein
MWPSPPRLRVPPSSEATVLIGKSLTAASPCIQEGICGDFGEQALSARVFPNVPRTYRCEQRRPRRRSVCSLGVGGTYCVKSRRSEDRLGETEDFVASVLPPLTEADTALHNGDAAPRIAIWSHNDPVTLFGTALMGSGWIEIRPVFESLASRFSNGTYEYEVIAAGASGDLGYMVGIEHSTVSVGGATPEAYELRVTEVFRREAGEWKVVRRHADPMPDGNAARRQLARLVEI